MAKKKMKKIILSIVIVLLVLILAGILIFILCGNRMIRTEIVTGAQKALKVDVRLESVDLKLLAGTTELKGLEIDNPKDYKHPTFLKLGRAYVELDTSTLLSDTIEIPLMQMEEIAVVIEQKGKTSNLKEILNNLPKSETAEPTPESESKTDPEKAGKNLVIKVLEINNVEVKAKLLPIPGRADTVTLKVKPIRLENIGTDEKIDAAGLTATIIKAISAGIAEQGKDLLPTDMIGSLTDELGQKSAEMLNAGQDASKELLEGTKDIGKETTESITEGIGGLFKKKEK